MIAVCYSHFVKVDQNILSMVVFKQLLDDLNLKT